MNIRELNEAPMREESHDNAWPLPKFLFLVDWGILTDIPFQEVSGLDLQSDTLEFRHTHSTTFSTVPRPGTVKDSRMTLSKGLFVKEVFWEWYQKIQANTNDRPNLKIKLTDERDAPIMSWILHHAWPAKVVFTTDPESAENEVFVERIEIAYVGITIANP
ncbi:MAG: phage tail protein [Mongoliitalea sp.]